MIATVSPSAEYAEESMSTLNYATRTMNITNKPVIHMDAKEQLIMSLKQENELLKRERDFLRQEFLKLTGSFPAYNGQTVESTPNQQKVVGMVVNQGNPELENEIAKMKQENMKLIKENEIFQRKVENLKNENNVLNNKLDNLENVFIGTAVSKHLDGKLENNLPGDYNMSAVSL